MIELDNNQINADNGRIISTTVQTSDNNAANPSIAYEYTNGRLSKMTVSGQIYNLTYDDFGNTSSIKVGTQTLASYEYAQNNGNRTRMTYGNGTTVNYSYDILGRVIGRTIGTGYSDSYVYSGEGPVKQRTTTAHGTTLTTDYTYDVLNRLIAMSQSVGSSNSSRDSDSEILRASYTYNNYNQMSGYSFSIPGIAENVNSTLDYFINDIHACEDGLPSHVGLPNGAHVWYNYVDGFARLHAQRVGPVKYEYTYDDGADYASPLVQTIAVMNGLGNESGSCNTDTPLFSTSYTYDVLGNIVSQTTGGSTVNYTYDKLNQLTSAGNDTFTYDNRGNLLTKKSSGTTHTYAYSTGDWKDQLIAYDNHPITYDGAGNPTSYYNGSNYTFTWENGRQLASATKGSTNVTYTYDGDGLRTSKTVDGETTHYAWSGGILLAQWKTNSSGTVTEKIVFLYDTGTTPVGFLRTTASNNDVSTWDAYYFAKNAQGDVLKVYDASMSEVASYTYDAWGKVLTATGTMADINPIRYRSYYFDSDTALYYLQSRYYDPAIGRFINADCYASTGQGIVGCNMYAYCLNNPVNYLDYSGMDSLAVTWASTGWSLCLVDGPLPIGEIVYVIGLFATGAVDLINTIGINNLANFFANYSDVLTETINRVSSSGAMPPNGPRYRDFTRVNFRYNLAQETGVSGEGMDAHHILPQAHIDKFEAAGLKINDPQYGTWVEHMQHLKFSYDYNQEWKAFFYDFPDATKEEILSFARYLSGIYGFNVNF